MGKTKILTDSQKQIILDAYTIEKRGQLYCSKKAKCSVYMVKKFLREQNIKIRNYSEAASQSNKNRAKKSNPNYFKNESRNMAWVLGFIAADGCISKRDNRIIINLSRTDREILERIKKELELEAEVKDYMNRDGFLCSSLAWSSEIHKKDLEEYNIIPQKTFKLKPPYKLNKKYYIDYIRGYFDGDGSVNLIKNSNSRGNGNLRWQVCSATKEIIEFIVNFLEEEFNIPKVSILSTKNSNETMPIYYAQYSSNSTRKIYKILYNESDLFLKRKKDHYEEILKKVKPLNDIKLHETAVPPFEE